jgi:predicted transcriptional regulator YheO
MCWWCRRVPKPPSDQTITLNINATVNMSGADAGKLDQILSQLAALTQQEAQMALDLTNLTDAVAQVKGVEDSGVVAINGLAAKVQDLINQSGNTVDPAQLQAIVDGMKANAQPLADAIAANPVP